MQVVRLWQKAGLVTLGHVALDGSKVRANASKHKAMSYGHMQKREEELAEDVRRHLEEAEAADRAEDERYGKGRRGDALPAWARSKGERLAKVREAKAALEAEAQQKAQEERARLAERPPGTPGPQPAEPSSTPDEKAQRNFTDPDSRIMKTRGGFEQSYNGHAAVDAGSQVIVACDLTNRQNDGETLEPMVEQIKANCGALPEELSADAGYASEANLRALEDRGIRGYVATGRQAHGRTSATKARTAESSRPLIREMRSRLRRGGHRSRYRLRKQTVEPVFGQMKECRGFRGFLLRGLVKVRAEWRLACVAHNVLKLQKARFAGG